MTPLEEANAIHADALARADGDTSVGMAILAQEVRALREGLRSLKGEENVTIPGAPNFKATRIISYHALNRAVDRILNPEPGS